MRLYIYIYIFFYISTCFVLTKSLRATMPVYMPPYASNVALFPIGEGPPLPLQVCAALFNTTLQKKDTYKAILGIYIVFFVKCTFSVV